MEDKFSFNKNKCLFLWLNDKEFHAVEAAKRGIEVAQVYKQLPTLIRAIRRIQIELNIPGIYSWIESWKKKIKHYETVIIHASKITPPVVKFIRRKNPDVRIIVWYWNPVDKCVSLDQFSDVDCEIWSFDEEDCARYGLKYNTQYYFNNVPLKTTQDKFDVFFVGGDKGRIKDLMDIKQKFDNLGISSYFHITPTGRKHEVYKAIYKERISYTKVLDYISESKAILDYVSEKQSGLTLRPLEALFFRKKLITNDKTIVNRDFYRRENIFVIGKDDIENLPQFLNTPYQVVEEEIVNKYDFDSWLDRFFNENI